MGTNQMVIFDALTLAVFNKDFEELSDTYAHIKQRNFVSMTLFFGKIPAFTAFYTTSFLERFMSKKIVIWPSVKSKDFYRSFSPNTRYAHRHKCQI